MKKLFALFIALSLSTAFSGETTFVELKVDKDKLKNATNAEIRDLNKASEEIYMMQPSEANIAAHKTIQAEIMDRAYAAAEKVRKDNLINK